MTKLPFLLACAAMAACAGEPETKIDDAFWSPRLKLWRTVTANDVLDKFEPWVQNFDRAAKKEKGGHKGPPFADGLVCETIRGLADHLHHAPDAALQARVEAVANRVAAVTDASPDGYLKTQTMLMFPERRWGDNGGNLMNQHELYDVGCIVEAAVHLYRTTGNLKLLRAATRAANLFCDVMGEAPKRNLVPTHSLPEEAFLKLWMLYRDNPGLAQKAGVEARPEAYRDLVFFWYDHRGVYGTPPRQTWKTYDQDHLPITEQPTIEGHAVRAGLMGTGLAASVRAGRRDYLPHAERLWANMVGRKMYVTGGIGAIASGEKFGPDYFLPSDAYLETCASIANAFWSAHMARITHDGMYADVVERVVYNALLTAVGANGNTYTYVNPLDSKKHSRWSWHGCPCCPPMFMKITGMLPELVWHQDGATLYADLFIGGETSFELPGGGRTAVKVTTGYPWSGKVAFTVTRDAAFTLAVRIPGWARGVENPWALYESDLAGGWSLKGAGVDGAPVVDKGYVRLARAWKAGDTVELTLPMAPRVVRAHPSCADLRGQVSYARGPLVYSFERTDNPALADFTVDTRTPFACEWRADLVDGVMTLRAGGLTAIPYYAVANRGRDVSFRTWVKGTGARVATASQTWKEDSIESVVDGEVPRATDLATLRRTRHHSFWPNKGTEEWLEVALPSVREVKGVDVWWFYDVPQGGCDLPAGWKVLAKEGDGWKEVAAGKNVTKDAFHRIDFKEPVKTRAVRIVATLRAGFSAGVYEIDVH